MTAACTEASCSVAQPYISIPPPAVVGPGFKMTLAGAPGADCCSPEPRGAGGSGGRQAAGPSGSGAWLGLARGGTGPASARRLVCVAPGVGGGRRRVGGRGAGGSWRRALRNRIESGALGDAPSPPAQAVSRAAPRRSAEALAVPAPTGDGHNEQNFV